MLSLHQRALHSVNSCSFDLFAFPKTHFLFLSLSLSLTSRIRVLVQLFFSSNKKRMKEWGREIDRISTSWCVLCGYLFNEIVSHTEYSWCYLQRAREGEREGRSLLKLIDLYMFGEGTCGTRTETNEILNISYAYRHGEAASDREYSLSLF